MHSLKFISLPTKSTAKALASHGRINSSFASYVRDSHESIQQFVGAAANRKAAMLFSGQYRRLQNNCTSTSGQYSNAVRPNWAFNRTNCGWLRQPQFSG
jgi:hypothetical protein